MEPKDLEARMRPLIEAEREELLKQSAATDADRRPVDLDQQSVGRLSRIDALQAQEMAKALEQRRKTRLIALDQALRRMEQGDYGLCADCGEPIDIRRLEIDPATVKCVACSGR